MQRNYGLKIILFIYFGRERERERESKGRGAKRGKERERIPSRLHPDSTEPNAGLEPMIHEIVT